MGLLLCCGVSDLNSNLSNLIDSGYSNNWYYHKYSNGTVMCWRTVTSDVPSGWINPNISLGTPPVIQSIKCRIASQNNWQIERVYVGNESGSQLSVKSESALTNATFSVLLIGTWK